MIEKQFHSRARSTLRLSADLRRSNFYFIVNSSLIFSDFSTSTFNYLLSPQITVNRLRSSRWRFWPAIACCVYFYIFCMYDVFISLGSCYITIVAAVHIHDMHIVQSLLLNYYYRFLSFVADRTPCVSVLRSSH